MAKRGNHNRPFKRGRGRGRGSHRNIHSKRDHKSNAEQSKQTNVSTFLGKCEQLCETDVGISEYISSFQGFEGLIKSRYSDFHVNEIDVSGNVAKLTDTQMPKEFFSKKVEPCDESPITEISADKWSEIKAMMESNDDSKAVKVECSDDKTVRGLIHTTVKDVYRNKIISNTVIEGDNKFIIFQKSSNNNRDNRGSIWPPNLPMYTHFLLYKESIDTMNAIISISQTLHMNSSSFNYAGVKDKRAKTTQWISAKRLNPSKLLFKTKKLRNIKIGNVTFKDTPLKLGQLSGNQFRIALRDVTADDETIRKNLNQVREFGFINYYGLQRFGNFKDIPTHIIGVKLLQGNFEEACKLILKPRSFENPLLDITKAKQMYAETGDVDKAAELLSKHDSIEAKLLSGLSRCGKNNFVNALTHIPRNMRLLYIHAFQSYVWNLVTSKRIKEFGTTPVIGDLVLVNDAETEVLSDDEQAILSDTESGTTEEGGNKNYKKTAVKILTEADLKNYTIFDIVLTLPGYDVTYPENSLKDYYKEILEKYELGLEMAKQSVKTYTLSGDYRKIVGRAENLEWKTIHYKDSQSTLIRSDFEEILGHKEPENDLDGKCKGVLVNFNLKPSSYATMVLREIMKVDLAMQINQSTSNVAVCTAKPSPKAECTEEDGSLLRDKTKFAALQKLIEDTSNDADAIVIPVKHSLQDEQNDTADTKRQKLDHDQSEEGIKIQASLI